MGPCCRKAVGMTSCYRTRSGHLRIRLDQESLAPLTVCLPALTDEEYDLCLADLTTWLDWLIPTYLIDHRTIPPCWPKHLGLVEELSALKTAWHTAYAVLAPGSAPMDWHTRLDACRQRLTDLSSRSGCRPGAHRGVPEGQTGPPIAGGAREPAPAAMPGSSTY